MAKPVAAEAPKPHHLWRRVSGAIVTLYRSMDPQVAQAITTPGVLPAGPDAPKDG